MPIDLHALAHVRVKFLEAREHLLNIQPTPNQTQLMQQLATSTYEFNRGLGLSAVRREAGHARDYYEDTIINVEQVTSSDFHHHIEIDDARGVMIEAADDIHGVIMGLPTPR